MLERLERGKKETAKDYAMRVLMHNIISLNLVPGQVISENEIAQILGISRTPVREAFIELSKASMVEIYPQRGTCIALIDVDMVEQSRFIRSVLEKAIIQLVCDDAVQEDIEALEENLRLQQSCVDRKDYKRLLSLDNEFHRLLFKACNKEAVYDLIESMMAHFDRVRMLNLAEMNMQKTVDEHKEILQFIKNRDKSGAMILIEQHLFRINEDITYLRQLHPEYFKSIC